MTNDEWDEFEAKPYVTIDELAAATEYHRNTVASRLKFFKGTKPGPNGSNLYPREFAWSAICAGADIEKNGPQKLEYDDILSIRMKLFEHRVNELQALIAPITSVARIKKEIRTFLKSIENEQREVAHALIDQIRRKSRNE